MSFRAAIAAFLVFAPACAFADEPSALAPLFACSEKADAAERLACFDATVAALRGAEARGEVAAIDSARIDTLQRESFGFSIPTVAALTRGSGAEAAPRREAIRSIEATIASARIDEAGKAVIALDNGQTWRQADVESVRRARVGAKVVIRRAAFGSFLMIIDGAGDAIRVARVQ